MTLPASQQEPRAVTGELLPRAETPPSAGQVEVLAQRAALFLTMQGMYEAGKSVRQIARAVSGNTPESRISKTQVHRWAQELGWQRSLAVQVVAKREAILRDETLDAERAREGAGQATVVGAAAGTPGSGIDGTAVRDSDGTNGANAQSLVPQKAGRRKTQRQAVDATARAQAAVISGHKSAQREASEALREARLAAHDLLKSLNVLREPGIRSIIAEAIAVGATSEDKSKRADAKSLLPLLDIFAHVEAVKGIVQSLHRAVGGGELDVQGAERTAHGIKDEEGADANEGLVAVLLRRRAKRGILGDGGGSPAALPSPRSPVS